MNKSSRLLLLIISAAMFFSVLYPLPEAYSKIIYYNHIVEWYTKGLKDKYGNVYCWVCCQHVEKYSFNTETCTETYLGPKNEWCQPICKKCEKYDPPLKTGYIIGYLPPLCGNNCYTSPKSFYINIREKCDEKDNNCDGLVDETCSGEDRQCIEVSNNTIIGSSANVASSNLYHSQTLFQTSNHESAVTLSYNSLATTIDMLGKGWTHNYNVGIVDYENTIIFIEKDGRMVYFLDNGDNTYSPNASSGNHSIITKNPDETYTLTEKTGLEYTFDSNGRLTSITDRNNNTLSLTYTGIDLTLITDPSGRQTSLVYDTNNRIISITDPTGRATTFAYNGDYLSTVTDPMGGIWTYTYDVDGRMLTKTDPLGRITTYAYDSYGKLISSQDPAGNIKTISYDQTNQKAYVTEKNGSRWTYKYNNTLNVPTEVTNPSANKITYQYDTNRNLILKREPGGITTKYTYDADGNMLTKTEAYGTTNQRTTSYTYNSFGQVLTITDPDGNTATYTYDANGNLIQETDAQGNTTSHTYGSRGEKLTTTDPNGNVTTYTYDQYGNVASITNALGQITTYTYDIMGNLLSMTDLNGHTTTYEYDLGNRLIKQTNPDGGVTAYEYDLVGNKTAITDANGNRTTFTYDGLNRLTKTTDPEGNSINYTYDAEGNVTSMAIKNNSDTVMTSTTYTYDSLNRLIKTTHADSIFTEQTYDSRGNLLTKKDENGNTTTYTYDNLNRLIQIQTPDSKLTTYTYDKRNNLKTVTDTNSNTTTYSYDSLNRLTSTTSPDTNTTTYSYDANSNMITKTDANGITTTYIYDSLNRLAELQAPNPELTTYYYDDTQRQNSIGRLTSMTDLSAEQAGPSGTTWYDYDKMGRVIKETKQINNIVYTTEYSYDLNGNLLTITYPGGRVITYTYNQLNKITSVTEIFNGVIKTLASNITSLPFGDMTSMIQGNGIVTTRAYDNRYQLGALNIGTLKSLSYTRDSIGNITAITDNLNPAKNKSYTYDSLYRLTQAAGPWGTITYSYDPAGNRTNETTDTGSTTYTYDANKLTSATGEKTFSFNYDANGSTTADNSRELTYNQNQRLTRITDTDTILGEYVYNGNGQRVKKTVNGQTTIFHYDQHGLLIAESTGTGTITNEYVYLNGQPLAKINSTVSGVGLNQPEPRFNASMSLDVDTSSLGTSWLKYYYTRLRLNLVSTTITGLTVEGNIFTVTGAGTVNGNPDYTFTATIIDGSPDAMGIEIRRPDGTLYYSASTQAISGGNFGLSDNIYYYHNDHLGTPVLMTDMNGNEVWEGEFLPFGEPLSVTGTVTNNLRFPGQYYDSETELHQNWHRDYKPGIGRYLTFDPVLSLNGNPRIPCLLKANLLDPLKLNPYIYAKSNPLLYVDPRGLVCGTGWLDSVIPDDYGWYDFTEPCTRHDKCYGCVGKKARKPKADCDRDFLKDMKEVCKKLSGYKYFDCTLATHVYYGAVQTIFGDIAYWNARKDCECK